MPKPPNSQWNTWRPSPVPTWMRGPNEPTEYDLAVQQLGANSTELAAWVRQWRWTKYVPEDVLMKMGLLERV